MYLSVYVFSIVQIEFNNTSYGATNQNMHKLMKKYGSITLSIEL